MRETLFDQPGIAALPKGPAKQEPKGDPPLKLKLGVEDWEFRAGPVVVMRWGWKASVAEYVADDGTSLGRGWKEAQEKAAMLAETRYKRKR